MGKKSAAFAENQFVFAKVKGYSPWPAKITKVVQKNRYGVYFYGTGETASVKTEDLDLYDAKKAKYNTERQMKKPDYQQAVSQIEAAIAGNDSAPATMEFDQNASELTTDGNDTTMLDDSSSIPPPEETTMAEEPPAPAVVESPPEPVATPPPPPAPVNLPKPEPVASPIVYPAEPVSSEKKSRSGRTIKEKKINEDEMDPDEMFSHPKKRAKVDSESKQHKSMPSANSQQTAASFNEFRASKMHILQDSVKKSRMQRQYDMITSIQDIKNALGLETTDAERAVELLEEFKESILPQINEVILLKYPNTVDTIRRLRKYIGNVRSWNLDEIQVEKFEKRAAQVRALANDIFDSFKKLFDFNEDTAPFWNKFAERQRKFNEKYNALAPEEIFEGLSEEDLDTLLSSKSTTSENDTQPATATTS